MVVQGAAEPQPTYKRCPRCGDSTLRTDGRNALSRHDNSTWVCDECGTDEALLAWNGKPVWPNFPQAVGDR